MNQKLIKAFKSLYTGEGFSSIMFFCIWLYSLFNIYENVARAPQIFMPVITLCFILMVGTSFWWLMLKAVRNQKSMHLTRQQVKGFKVCKVISEVLLVLCTCIIIYNTLVTKVYVAGSIFLYLFAVVEYINYYHIRLSYLTLREFKELLKHKRLRPSHLRRLLNESK